MNKRFIHGILAGLVVLIQPAWAGPQNAPALPSGGMIEIHDTLADFLAAVADPDALVFEDFDGSLTPLGSVMQRVCDNPQHSRMGIPATNFINRCFMFGELNDGFSIRIEGGGVLRVIGTHAIGGARPTNVIGTFPGLQATLIDFVDPPTAVALDVYQPEGLGTVMIEVFAFDGRLMGTLEVDPPSINEAAFAGFTASVPIGRVRLLTTSPGFAETVGAMHFGGGRGRLEISADAVDFGHVAVGDSALLALEVSNGGELALGLQDLPEPAAPFFLDEDTCSGITLGAGEACTLVYGFEPQVASDFTETVMIAADAGDPLALMLTGQAFVPTLSVVPQRWDFGMQEVGQTADAVTVRVANFESAPITVEAIQAASGPFTQTGGDCPVPPFDLAAGEFCTLSYDYQPQVADAAEALVVFESSGLVGVQALHLSGRGLASDLTVVPKQLDFGKVAVGDDEVASLDIQNTGTAALEITAIDEAAMPFERIGGACPDAPFTLEPGAGCSIEFRFAPSEAGDFSQDLEIASDVGSVNVVLAGVGIGTQDEPVVGFDTGSSLDFGSIASDDSAERSVAIRNVGGAVLEISQVIGPDAPFSLMIGGRGDGACAEAPFDLEPGEACTWTIRFEPGAAGAYSDSLTIASNASSSPDEVTLSGTGTAVADAVAIPTLNHAGLLALMLLILGMAGWFLYARR